MAFRRESVPRLRFAPAGDTFFRLGYRWVAGEKSVCSTGFSLPLGFSSAQPLFTMEIHRFRN
jgi:hypothetical protein